MQTQSPPILLLARVARQSVVQGGDMTTVTTSALHLLQGERAPIQIRDTPRVRRGFPAADRRSSEQEPISTACGHCKDSKER